MNNLFKFLFCRLIGMIPVLFIISLVLFAVTKSMPGDPVDIYLGMSSEITPERREAVRELLGLNNSFFVQYSKWSWRMLQGEFGDSLVYRRPVKDIIGPSIKNSFILNITGLFFAFLFTIPMGVAAAIHKNKLWDKFWTIFSLIGFCFPSFFIALLVIFAFSIKIPIFPMSGMSTPGLNVSGLSYIVDILKHLALPLIVVTLGSMAGLFRYIRNTMMEVLKQDYIRTARAKGVKAFMIIYYHAFRNALIPMVTLMGFMIPALFGGSVILETIFVWPGIGKEFYSAIIGRDYNLVMALNMCFTLLTLFGNLLADIGYAFVDPRVRLD